MAFIEFLSALVGYVLFALAVIHAIKDTNENRMQRMLMLITLFVYGFLLEYLGVISGNYHYATFAIMIMGIIPLPVTFAWVGIIYSVMIIGERLELPVWLRILSTTLIALSLDWGMDPVAVEIGAWTWTFKGAPYFGVPSFNFVGWFFIPIAYLIPYGLNWNQEEKKLSLLNIAEIDNENTLIRKLYTLLCVIPISMGILFIVGIFSSIPIVYNMPLIPLIIWAVLTVIIASGMIIWKRENLKRTQWFDIIPPTVLIYIGLNYAFYGFLVGRADLGFLMLLTGIPLWLAFIFTLQKPKS